jgi:hypothetical protein
VKPSVSDYFQNKKNHLLFENIYDQQYNVTSSNVLCSVKSKEMNDQQDRVLLHTPNSRSNCNVTAHCWFWDGMEHVDPIKEAKASTARIDSRVSNLAIECAKVGLDWEDVLVQAAREHHRMIELGLNPNNANNNNSDTESEDEDDENEDIETDESATRTGTNYTRRSRRQDDNT